MRVWGASGICVVLAACLDLSTLDESDGPVDGSRPDAVADSGSNVEGGPILDGAIDLDGAALDGAPDTPATVDGGDASTSWKLYVNGDGASAWNVVPLDVAWTGANAPPSRGIMAVAQLTDFDRLLVWADDGKFYVRDATTWRTPQTTAVVFPQLAGRDFRGCYHQPSVPNTPPASRVESLILVDNPTAILYDYLPDDTVQYTSSVTMTDEPAPYGAMKASKKARWVMRSWRPAQYGSAGYLAEYSGYDNDGNVYFFDATPAPTNKWAFADAPIFAGKTNVPPRVDIMAAWRDDKIGAHYIITR